MAGSACSKAGQASSSARSSEPFLFLSNALIAAWAIPAGSYATGASGSGPRAQPVVRIARKHVNNEREARMAQPLRGESIAESSSDCGDLRHFQKRGRGFEACGAQSVAGQPRTHI